MQCPLEVDEGDCYEHEDYDCSCYETEFPPGLVIVFGTCIDVRDVDQGVGDTGMGDQGSTGEGCYGPYGAVYGIVTVEHGM